MIQPIHDCFFERTRWIHRVASSIEHEEYSEKVSAVLTFLVRDISLYIFDLGLRGISYRLTLVSRTLCDHGIELVDLVYKKWLMDVILRANKDEMQAVHIWLMEFGTMGNVRNDSLYHSYHLAHVQLVDRILDFAQAGRQRNEIESSYFDYLHSSNLALYTGLGLVFGVEGTSNLKRRKLFISSCLPTVSLNIHELLNLSFDQKLEILMKESLLCGEKYLLPEF